MRWLLICAVVSFCLAFSAGRPAAAFGDGEQAGKSAPPSNPSPGQEWLDPVTGASFVWIPPGSFEMGSQCDCPEEKPQHQVTIPAGFWMGRYEVTQGQWKKVMGDNNSWFGGRQNPVESASTDSIDKYIKNLNHSKSGPYRLPSEAEWEYACRAGSTSRYYWGDSMNGDYCWWRGNAKEQPHQVGKKKPNNWGLYDMIGNVDELCQDSWHRNYQGAPQDASAWRAGGNQSILVVRGGSWYTEDPDQLRCGFRIRYFRGMSDPHTGFRLVREP